VPTQARGFETQERILESAAAEFTEHGVAGARINRIAANAQASKERIYAWFSDKDSLFDTVMRHSLDDLAQAVPISSDLVDYTVRLHDYFTERPQIQRRAIQAWLHDRGEARLPSERLQAYRHKIQTIEQAQRTGLADVSWEPHQLLAMLLTLATSWLMAPAELRQIADSAMTVADRREQVRHAAARIVAPDRP
jgi:AcrR family transcriptional regulator